MILLSRGSAESLRVQGSGLKGDQLGFRFEDAAVGFRLYVPSKVKFHLPSRINPWGHQITIVSLDPAACRIVDVWLWKRVGRGLYGLRKDHFARACMSQRSYQSSTRGCA